MTDQLEPGLFAVDKDARTIRGLLIPWGERSRQSVSKTKPLVFVRGAVSVPRDPSVVGLNRMHDRFDPIGRGVDFDDTDAGLVATFRIAETDDGDAYLAEPGNLRRLSAEVRGIRRNHDGTATAELVGSALVDEGAFASAALFAIDPDEDDEDDAETAAVEDAHPLDGGDQTTDPAPVEPETEPDTQPDTEDEEEAAVTDAAPTTMLARRGTPSKPKPDTGETGEFGNAFGLFAAMSRVVSGHGDADLLARIQRDLVGSGEGALFALNDVKYDGTGGVGSKMAPSQWLAEVTDGVDYRPVYADLFTPASLTQLSMAGWQWTTKPAGGSWNGNKAAIPSNAPAVAAVTDSASRWAGGHDHAREHRDFGTPGYFESYYAAMVESFYRWLDTLVITEGLAASTELEADNPAGLTIGSGMSALIDGAAEVVTAGRIPTFGLVSTANWKQMLKTPNSDTLGYLNAALGLESGTLERAGFIIRPSADLGAGVEALVGTKSSARVYTLPGAPIRAEALNIANGGIDTGVFGYGGFLPVNPLALVKVTTYTP